MEAFPARVGLVRWAGTSPRQHRPKGRYVWRDLERLAEERPAKSATSRFRNGLLAARVALVGSGGRVAPFARAVMSAGISPRTYREIGEAVIVGSSARSACPRPGDNARSSANKCHDALPDRARGQTMGLFRAPKSFR